MCENKQRNRYFRMSRRDTWSVGETLIEHGEGKKGPLCLHMWEEDGGRSR